MSDNLHINNSESPAVPRYGVAAAVARALIEDIGDGDITAELIPADKQGQARVITRTPGIFCGVPWATETCYQVDPDIALTWHVADGDSVAANDTLLEASGPARSLLTAERTMLNFVQLLSGTATMANHYARIVEGTEAKVLDTRKTVPGLRMAQKYAVWCGGANNHRFGLFDAFLIKENHIASAGSISAAIATARNNHPEVKLEVEVENFDQLHEALDAEADIIMLDNFSTAQMAQAAQEVNHATALEASGNITEANLREVAETGVHYISMGVITKNVEPMDLSMRFVMD